MNKIQSESYILVAVQFLCIGILIYLTLGISLGFFSILLITIGIAIGLWAMLTMQFGNFRVQPVPKVGAQLVTSGPYRFIRHPMYLAVLLVTLGLAFNINAQFGYIIWIVLFIDLLIKMRFEEKLLLGKFPEFKEYMKRTSRLLPKV